MSILLLRLLPYALGVAALSGVIFGIHHDGYLGGKHEVQQKWDKEKADKTASDLQMVLANQKLIKKLEEVKNVNITEIDRLRANNHALWLRLPKTPCPALLAATSGNAAASAGVVSTETETAQGSTGGSVAQSAFDEYERGRNDEAYRADKIVEDCRAVVDWATSLAPP